MDSHPEVNLVELKCVPGTSSPQAVDVHNNALLIDVVFHVGTSSI